MKELMKERRWCVRDQGKKPYMAYNIGGNKNDPSTWLSYEEAKNLLKQYPEKFTGLGLYFRPKEVSNLCLCGIDIDAIHHDANHRNPLADEILSAFRGTYAEQSPSRAGYHIFFYIDVTRFHFNKDNYPYQINNRDSGLEAYVGFITSSYFTYTGLKLEEHVDQVTDQTEQFLDFLSTYMRRPKKAQRKTSTTRQPTAEAKMEPDFDLATRFELIRNSPKRALFETLFDKGDISKYTSPSEADFALLCLLVPWLEGSPSMLDSAYRQSALFKNGRNEKWDSKRGEYTYGERTIRAAIDATDEPYYSEDHEYATGDSITPEDVVRRINEIQQDESCKDKVSVLPIACGLGKSTAISYKIAEVLNSPGTDGLIVVTDSVKRMYNYISPADEKLSALKENLERHKNEISLMEHDTILVEKQRQNSCRVLILSTQRFIQMLTREQIIGYTTWEKGKRPLILIDERPGVLQFKRLTIGDMNAVDEILRTLRLHNNDIDEQDWCLEQWDNVTKSIKADERKYSRYTATCEGNTYYFCRHDQQQMTDDDDRFYRFISANGYAFTKDKNDHIGTIRAAHQFLTSWSIVERSSAKDIQTTKFYSHIDYQDKIKDLGAKVIILDGTADLSPEYNNDLYDVRESPAYRRWLDRLTINLVDFPTTREAVANEDPHLLAEKIKDYAWRRNKGKGRRSVVFTYKAKGDKGLETELKALFNNEESNCNVDHLGAIHGKNDYNSASLIIQFGLLQYSRCGYMLYAISNDESLLERLENMNTEEASAELKALENSYTTNQIRSRLILTDLEQNFYRGCIRMSNSEEKMDCDVFFSVKKYSVLHNLMLLRYLPLHAKIQTQRRPKEFDSFSDAYRKDSNSDRLLKHLVGRKSGRFCYKHITDETGLTTAQISQARNRHKDIDKLFRDWQDENDKNWYCKPEKQKKYNRKINRK